MGVRMHVPSDPAAAKAAEVDESSPGAPPTSGQHPFRRASPAGGIRLEGAGWRLKVPQVALVAILGSLGGAGVGAKVVAGGAAETSSETLEEVRLLRAELKELRGDLRDVRGDLVSMRGADGKLASYVQGSVTPIVASLRKLGVKLEYEPGGEPAEVEFHPPPMNPRAPQIQPKAVLPAKPNL